MRRSRGSVTSRCPTNCTRSPPATCRVVARADRCSRCSPVRYVTACNRLVVLTNTERQGRYRERREAGESRCRQPADPRRASGHDGTEGRPPPRVRVGHAATCSVAGRVRPAVHSGPKVRRWCGSGRAARPPSARRGPPSPSRSPRARDTMRSTRSQARRLVAAVDADSTGSGSARHPESGGLPRPAGIVDGRAVPSRPGRKQRYAFRPATGDIGQHQRPDEAAGHRRSTVRDQVGLDEARSRVLPIAERAHRNPAPYAVAPGTTVPALTGRHSPRRR